MPIELDGLLERIRRSETNRPIAVEEKDEISAAVLLSSY